MVNTPLCSTKLSTTLQLNHQQHYRKGTKFVKRSRSMLNTDPSSWHRKQYERCTALCASRQGGEQYAAAMQLSHRVVEPPKLTRLVLQAWRDKEGAGEGGCER